MANQFSAGKAVLVEPELGSYVNSWNGPVNSNFGVIDATVSGTTTIDVSVLTPGNPFILLEFQNYDTNNSPQTNPKAAQNLRLRVIGALAFDISIIVPKSRPGLWIVDNQTTGAFKVFIKTDDAATVPLSIAQGYMSTVFGDGISFNYADAGTARSVISNHVATGTIILYALTTVPSIEYLKCDGTAVSRITYANLFSVIGTTWGAGDGVNTFNVPNLTFATSPATYMIKI